MADRRDRPAALVLDDGALFSVHEVSEVCGVRIERIVEVVEHGLVDAHGSAPDAWRFTATAVFRMRRAIRLCDDLGVNLAGASLAVELLEELDRLRSDVARLNRLLHR